MDTHKDNFNTATDSVRVAFDELCNMVEAVNAEREEKREAATNRFTRMKAYNQHLREKNRRLRAKYIACVDA